MAESDAFGMEIEAVGGGAVEDVAPNGTAETFGMGTVDAQLMCATCLREQLDAAVPFIYIMCNGGFTKAVIDHLAGRVERVA